MDFRHELKFLTSLADLELLRARIIHIVKSDKFQTDSEGYFISSLYFDDYKDTCVNETVDGYDIRNKYRLRIYDHNPNLIKLERKSKVNGMTSKTAVTVSKEECLDLMNGIIPTIKNEYSKEKKQILCEMKIKGMKPKCIVQYEREAFVNKVGNVRITFDKNISGSRDVKCFLDERINVIPLLNTNAHILEVKYDNFLPQYIKDTLEIGKLLQTAFSKYVYARNKII